jgi:hypothetical protein
MQAKMDFIITIATFYDPFRAQIFKTKLESEGIPCFLADGNLLPSASFFSNEGGVKLKVRREDAEKARDIIERIN